MGENDTKDPVTEAGEPASAAEVPTTATENLDVATAPLEALPPPAAEAAPAEAPSPVEEKAAPTPPPVEQPAWILPPTNPERARRRRTRPGRFAGGLVPAILAACLLPAIISGGYALQWWGTPQEAAPPPVDLSPMRADVEKVKGAVTRAQEEMKALYEPSFQMARLEARRSAYRGAALVEQEIRRINQEQQHAVALEAALTRQPALAGKQKNPPLAPPLLEPFLKTVGLTSPLDALEGEVVVDEAGNGVGAPLPEAFKALVEASAAGPAEVEGRIAQRAPVKGMGVFVVAVRKLPAAMEPRAFSDVGPSLDRLLDTSQRVPEQLQVLKDGQARVEERLKMGAWLGLVMGVLMAALALWRYRVRVLEPLRHVRDNVERVRSGGRPEDVAAKIPLHDLHVALQEIAQRLQDTRDEAEANKQKSAVMDGIMDACQRAQQGDYTVRPSVGDGSEGLTALAVSHLLDAVEERAVRARTQARSLLESISACEQMSAPSLEAPSVRAPLETIQKRLESLLPLSGLLRNLAARLQTLTTQPNIQLVHEDLARLATAVAPRAQAVAALLADLQDNARKLGEALGGGHGSGMTDALARARQAAADLARDTRSTRADESFPGLLSAMRGVPPPELERAWRMGLEPPDNTPS